MQSSAQEIITSARYRTGNKKFTENLTSGETTGGLATSLFLEFLNDSQSRLQGKTLKLYPSLFTEIKEANITANGEAYTIDDEVAYGAKIIAVQYSITGNAQDYRPLDPFYIRDRQGFTGVPTAYARIGKTIYLNYIPTSAQGKLRYVYYRRLDKLDISRGQVNGSPNSTTIAVDGTIHVYQLTNTRYICISDIDGNVMLQNGVVESYATNVLTLEDSVSSYLVDGYSLTDLDNGYITVGKFTTTHSKLPEEAEPYLRIFTQKRTMTSNENTSSIEEDQEVKDALVTFLGCMAEESRDTEPFPITDQELMY